MPVSFVRAQSLCVVWSTKASKSKDDKTKRSEAAALKCVQDFFSFLFRWQRLPNIIGDNQAKIESVRKGVSSKEVCEMK